VTNYSLYAIYVGAYSDSSHFADDGDGALRAIARQSAWLSAIERAIAELAAHDATNGTPMRSKAQFDRCLEDGALLLQKLEVRHERPTASAAAGRGGVACATG